jgi:hypothetical protein
MRSSAPLWAGPRNWTARIFRMIPVVMIGLGAILKLISHPSVVQGFAHLGIPANLLVGIGLLELLCTALYVIPATSVLGAILLTGLLGGAIAVNVRIGSADFLLPLTLGVFMWGGLLLHDDELRSLIPMRNRSKLHP